MKKTKNVSISDKILQNKEIRHKIIFAILHTETYIVTPEEIDAVALKEIIASGLNFVL